MSNLRMKRFDAMQSSKRSIIEKTNAQLQSGHVNKRSSNVFYFIGLTVVTCIVSIGLYYLLLKDTTPVQQVAPVPSIEPNEQPKEEIIKMSVIADGRIIIRGEQFYFQVDDHTINTVPILKEYVSAETLLLIDERYHEEIKQAFSPQIKENASINATFTINDLRKLDGGAYKIEQLEIVSYNDSGFNRPALFTLNFDVQGKVVLDEQLLTRYEAFKGNYEREALRGLSPVEVFYLYEYAYDQNDSETAYELIMPDEPYLKPDKEDFLKESSGEGDQQRIHPFYGKNLYLTIFKSNGELKANLVTEDESQFFGLTQSKDGIWFVNFLPMQ
jgi:hypothetical protein